LLTVVVDNLSYDC